jgi:hypothetical protein
MTKPPRLSRKVSHKAWFEVRLDLLGGHLCKAGIMQSVLIEPVLGGLVKSGLPEVLPLQSFPLFLKLSSMLGVGGVGPFPL